MKPDLNLSRVLDLIEMSRYQEALKELRSNTNRQTIATPPGQAVLAELLQECGHHDDAQATAAAVLANDRADESAKARALCALAKARHVQGSNVDSSRLFSDAQRLAAASGDSRLLCLTQLAALGTVADSWPQPRLAALVDDLRRRVARSADRRLIALLHYYLARFAVFAGDIAIARKHLAAARRLADPDDRMGLEGKLVATEANICWFTAEYEAGVDLCDRAIRLFEASGSRWDSIALRSTRCWYLLHLGRYEAAEHALSELFAVGLPVLGRLLALDTYTNLLLATGRTGRAEQSLAEMSAALAICETERPSFYEVSWQESRYRLLGQVGDWHGAEVVAADAVASGLLRREGLSPIRFRVFRCEARLRQGKLGEAIEDAVLTFDESENLTAGHRAQLDRVLGLLFAACGEFDMADRHLARAVRINRASGNLWANVEAEKERTQIGKVVRGGSIGDSIDITTTMFSVAGRADLLAAECVDLLSTARCFRKIELVSVGQRGDVKLLGLDASASADGSSELSGATGIVKIETGERNRRDFQVLVQPENDLASRLLVVSATRLVQAARELERLRQAERERQSLWPQSDFDEAEDGAVFASADMKELLVTARRIAPADIPVLLTGETGTGKEVLARAIHRASSHAAGPFLPFNCAAVPRDLIDSQLFGYRRGAFTGAQDAFDGVIRGAAGGTLLLDEIGELPPETQPKLLRFLETREIHPLGETRPLTVDTRVIAATNADLDRLIEERRFRTDLLYRLNAVHLELPPLRKRREEIPALVHHFLRRYADEIKRGRPRVSEDAMEYLLLYAWPGNIRQLANEIRRAVALVESDGAITPDALSAPIRASRRTMPADARPRANEILVSLDRPLGAILESVERLAIGRALETSKGQFAAAARRLGISRKGLFLKRRRWGLQPPP